MNQDFSHIEQYCQGNSDISRQVIDEFLIYFIAAKEDLDRQMNLRLKNYKHITDEVGTTWVNMIKSQYLCHRTFKQNGLISKYMNHHELSRLGDEGKDFLKKMTEKPWRYSFHIIKSRPADRFFEMEDVFTGESFLMYSPGIQDILEEGHQIRLWLNLIAYNGKCWVTFGAIIPFYSFEPDDIFYFATEVNPLIEDEDDLMDDVEKNPWPYLMLVSGASFPVTVHKNDLLVQCYAEHNLDEFTSDQTSKDFNAEFHKGVYKLSLKKWNEYPHFVHAYYDEKEKVMALSAFTDRGFAELVKRLKSLGFSFPPEPQIRLNNSMHATASSVLRRKIIVNHYDRNFNKPVSPQEREEIGKLNAFMQMILPDINEGREPDIKLFAEKAGIDFKTAKEFYEIGMKQRDKMFRERNR